MQPVVDQEHALGVGRVTAVADVLARVRERGPAVAQQDRQAAVLGRVAGRVGVAALLEREVLVEEGARPRDHGRTALGVVRAPVWPGLSLLAVVLGEGVGAVEGVVERAPAGVGGVGGEPRVEHRHDELRAGLDGDLPVHVAGLDGEVGGLVDEVAEVAEQLDVRRLVANRARVLLVPLVELLLELVAAGQQLAVAGGEVTQDRFDTGPEGVLVHTRPGQRLVAHECVQHGGHLEPADGHSISHDHSYVVGFFAISQSVLPT